MLDYAAYVVLASKEIGRPKSAEAPDNRESGRRGHMSTWRYSTAGLSWASPQLRGAGDATLYGDDLTTLAAELSRLYPCSRKMFAYWNPDGVPPPSPDGKQGVSYREANRSVHLSDWEAHLAGTQMLAVALHCDNGDVQVSIVDDDRYRAGDPRVALDHVADLKLPLYVSLTKSRGVHFTAFHDRPISMDAHVEFVESVARLLGFHSNYETIPHPRQPHSRPQVVNLPYAGHQRGESGFFRPKGTNDYEVIPLHEFLDQVQRVTAADRQRLAGEDIQDQGKGRQYAMRILDRFKRRIADEAPGGRNKMIHGAAWYMGRMVARGWVLEQLVEDELLKAAVQAGWDNSDKPPGRNSSNPRFKTHNTIHRGVTRGMKDPHPDIDDGIIERMDAIFELNSTYAVVVTGGRTSVLRELPNSHYEPFDLMSPVSFREWMSNRYVTVEDKSVPLAKYWLNHPERRQYNSIVFAPGDEDVDGYNLWRGFAVKAREGDCSRFLWHLHDNVCQGNEDLYGWVEAWLADIVQNPAGKCGTSLVLSGDQGTGKTIVAEYMKSILGRHALIVNDQRFVTGQFNTHLASCLLLCADEAFWAGDPKAVGRIRDLITGDEHFLEPKGREAYRVSNYVRVLVLGEANWMVPAALTERRFATLEMGTAHAQDHIYFQAIDDEMRNGGSEALLYHLLYQVDCSQVDLRQIPTTGALLNQKMRTMSPEESYLFSLLHAGQLPGDPRGLGETTSRHLYDDYLQQVQSRGINHRLSPTSFGMFLAKHVPGMRKQRTVGGVHRRFFPPLAVCRRHFAQVMRAESHLDELEWNYSDTWMVDNLPPSE